MKEHFNQFSNSVMSPQFSKKVERSLKKIRDQSAFQKICEKYLKTLCINRWLPSWINIFPNFNVAVGKAIAHTSVSLH